MQARSQVKIATFKQYQVSYDINSNSLLNITVCNMVRLIKFSQSKINLHNINLKGFQMAMNHSKDFDVELKEINQQDKEKENKNYLQMKILFKSSFIRSVPEVIIIPFKSKVSQLDFFVEKTCRMQQKIKKIQEKNEQNIKFFNVIDEKIFRSNYNQMYEYDQGGYDDQNYDMRQFFSLTVQQPGKYLVQISMLLKCLSTGYFYFYKDMNYQSCFPSGALSIPITRQYVPIKFSFIHQCIGSNTFYTYDTYDYPFEATNIVVTATRIK